MHYALHALFIKCVMHCMHQAQSYASCRYYTGIQLSAIYFWNSLRTDQPTNRQTLLSIELLSQLKISNMHKCMPRELSSLVDDPYNSYNFPCILYRVPWHPPIQVLRLIMLRNFSWLCPITLLEEWDPPFNATTPVRNSNGYSIHFLIKIIENPRTTDVYEAFVYWQSQKAIL